MKWVMSLVALLLVSVAATAEEKLVTIEGLIVNHKGKPFTNVTIHAFGQVYRSVKSDSDGKWQFEVPAGEWLIRVDPHELLVRGYGCFPDWNQPVFETIEEIKFEVIPTRPIFSELKIAEGEVNHTITFETTLLPIENVRTYMVQKATGRTCRS